MPLNSEHVVKALQHGAPITCATCKPFHEKNGFCGVVTCGGPVFGRDFPNYDGAIPRERFVERCLACGSPDTRFAIIGLPTKFSLCTKHEKIFSDVSAPSFDGGHVLHPVIVIAHP